MACECKPLLYSSGNTLKCCDLKGERTDHFSIIRESLGGILMSWDVEMTDISSYKKLFVKLQGRNVQLEGFDKVMRIIFYRNR